MAMNRRVCVLGICAGTTFLVLTAPGVALATPPSSVPPAALAYESGVPMYDSGRTQLLLVWV
jgi:hypothetical protein